MTKAVDIIDKEALFEELNYKPHPTQWIIHRSEARFRIPCCGRRYGKSQFAGHEFTAKLFIPETMWWICGPTYKLGEKEFRVIWNDLKTLGILDSCPTKQYNINQGNMLIRTPWDSVVEVVSAEKQTSLVGEGLDGVIMSEAAKHKESTWSMYIEPALSDKRGEAIFPSTPQGFNWYKGLYDIGQLNDFTDYESWRFPTWANEVMFPGGEDNPELQRIKRVVSTPFWMQEYAAEFTTFEGQIYPDFNENVHVRNIQYNPDWRNYLAFDFGWTDPFICLDIMVDPSDNFYVWREYVVTHLSTWEHGWVLKSRQNPPGYHIDAMYADPRGADEAATLEMVLGPIFREDVPWPQGVEAIRRYLKPQDGGTPKLYFDKSCIHSIRQMKQLRARDHREGKNERPGQHDYDDHCPDALRYFVGPYIVLGMGMSLGSVYSAAYGNTEAAGFFTHATGISLSDRIGF